MMEYGDLSEQLRRRRKEAGLSLSQLARRADTSAATLSRYENGWTRFELYTLRKLASAMGCRLKIALEREEREISAVSEPAVVRQLGRLFWDRKLKKGDLKQYPMWVLERVLEYGSLADTQLLMKLMGREVFLERVGRARLQSAKTKKFWEKILEREGLSCTRKYSRNKAGNCWPA